MLCSLVARSLRSITNRGALTKNFSRMGASAFALTSWAVGR